MRAVILVLSGVLCIWAVLRYRPTSEVAAETDGSTPAAEQAAAEPGRFLSRPGREEVSEPPAARAEREAPRTGSLPEGSKLAPQPRTSGPIRGDERELAARLLYGDPAALNRDLQGDPGSLTRERARAIRAFAAVLDGELQTALDLLEDLDLQRALGDGEIALLELALRPDEDRKGTLRASYGREEPVAKAMAMRLREREAERHFHDGEFALAAALFSDLLLEAIDAPWRTEGEALTPWAERLNEAQMHHRWSRRGRWPALEVEVEPGDNLSFIRKRLVEANPDLRLCTGLIERLNGLEGRYLQPGELLRVPVEAPNMRVDLETRWAFYLFGDEVARAWRIAIGAVESPTRTGEFRSGEMLVEPMWFRRGQDPVPYGSPDNPLGTRWIGWDELEGSSTGFGFHGTWEPETLGQAVSDGCIRFRNEDVEELFQILPRDSRVAVSL